MAGLAENKANSANPAELELGLSWAELGNIVLSFLLFLTEKKRNSPKQEEKNKFILFFCSQTKNCRLPKLNGIILLLNKRKKSKNLLLL